MPPKLNLELDVKDKSLVPLFTPRTEEEKERAIESKSSSPLLFGKLVVTLPPAPTLSSLDKFGEWKKLMIQYGTTHNVSDLLTKDTNEAWKVAKESNFAGISELQLEFLFKQQCACLYVIIQQAVSPASIDLEDLMRTTTDSPVELVSSIPLPPFVLSISPHLVWCRLIQEYDSHTVFSGVQVFKRIVNLQLKDGDHPTNHRNEFVKLVEQLTKLSVSEPILSGQLFPESFKAVLFLMSFPKTHSVEHTMLMSQEK